MPSGLVVWYVGARTFRASGITSITIPSTVEAIGNYTFYNCKELESVKIDARVKYLGSLSAGANTTNGAFYGCEKLKDVTLPATLETVGNNMFLGCTSLENVVLPKSVKTIEGHAFQDCASLKTLDFGGVEEIGICAFRNCGLTSIVLPSTVKTISMYAFQYSSNLKSVLLPESVTSVGSKAFAKIGAGSNVMVMNGALYDDMVDYPPFYVTSSRTSIWKGKGTLDLKVSMKDWFAGAQPSTPSVTGNSNGGEVVYSYYSDSALTKQVNVAELSGGTYYVKAEVAADDYFDAASASTSFKVKQLGKGKVIKSGALNYKVLSSKSDGTGTVSVSGVASKAAKSLAVPATVKLNGFTCKVTGIGASAFKGAKAKTLTVKSGSLTKRGVKGSLKGSKVATVKLSGSAKSKKSSYKKYFAKSNSGKAVTVK